MGECLDPELLSAYVDGKLDVRERAEVEAHLASCADCYEVMSEVLRIQEAISAPVPRPGGETVVRGAFGRRTAVWGVAGALLTAAAALVLVVQLQPTWWTGGVDPKLADLVEAVGEERTVEARLTGGFKYGPLRSPVRSGGRVGPTDNWTLLAAAGRIREVAEKDPTPENLHALGVAQLLLGEYDSAVETLESAASASDDAKIRCDLAASLLARANNLDQPEDLPRALDVIEESRTSRPDLAESAFTRALILGRLGLEDEAQKAWQQYLALDPDSSWAAEAKRRLGELEGTTPRTRLDELRRLFRSDRKAGTAAISREFPDQLPDLALVEILPTWARALRAGQEDDARQALEGLDAGIQVWGATEFDRALRLKIQSESALNGIESLGRGTELLRADRYIDAGPFLERALVSLEPFPDLAGWAAYGLARVRYFQGDTKTARTLLASVLNRGLLVPSSLRPRALWIRGLLSFSEGRWSEARADYDRARQAFVDSGEKQGAATVSVNLSIMYRFLGDRSENWRHRMAALSTLPRHQPSLEFAYLTTTAITASLETMNRAAVVFMDEALEIASTLPPQLQAVARLQRARMLSRVGNVTEATNDLNKAESAWRRIEDSAIGEQVRVALLCARAEILWPSEPLLAIDAAQDAIDLATKRRDSLRLAELNLYLARADRKVGRRMDAARAISDGIKSVEAALDSLPSDDPVRLSSFEPVWPLFDEAVRLHLDGSTPDYVSAFDFLERSRARSLFEFRRLKAIDLAGVRAAMLPHLALVFLHQMDDELVVWLESESYSRVFRRPLSAQRSRLLVEEHRRGISNEKRAHDSDAELVTAVLAPVLDLVQGGVTLVIVPDGPLANVAWSALRWPLNSHDAVIQHWPVVVAPSAAVALERSSRPSLPPQSVLVVAAPATGEAVAALPGARSEATAISRAYSHADVLTGSAATAVSVIERIPRADVIHIAAHAVDSPYHPMLSRLLLAPDQFHERGLDIAEILRSVKLRRDQVVVLATCSSVGRLTRRGEGAVGLAWAFLAAGARAVVATLWEIDDATSVLLFEDLHRHLASGQSPAVALRAAQQAARERGAPASAWAGITVVGQP